VTFLQPLMLWGALAAFIPLLVHLFDRRRPRPHPFAAISFVLRSQKRTASRLKLRRLILYILRTIVLLAVPLALARPTLTSEAAALTPARGPAATAIVLDTSLSMRFSDGTPLFERGRDEARDALRDLLPEEPATVMLCGGRAEPPPAPLFDRARLRAVVDEARPSYAGADVTRCLELAARALEESPLTGKRLVVISDMTQRAFRLEAPPPQVKGPAGQAIRPEVVLRDAAAGRKVLPNRAVVDLKAEPAPQAGPRAFQFTFTVRNFSPEPVSDLEAALKIDGHVVAKGFLDLAADGTAQKTLTHRFEQGGSYFGQVELAADGLPEDDRRPFVVTVPKELRALVINGSPHSVRHRDEAFFVAAALDAPGSPVQQTMRDLEAGLRERLEDFEVVLLLNVPAPTGEDARRLVEFVHRGGGLFISAGDQVNPDDYNKVLGEVLPRPLRLVKTAATREEPDAETRAARLLEIRQEHPVMAPFTGRAREGLMSSRFYRYMLVEADPGRSGVEPSEVLATYEDGAPAIAVARRGKGRVMLLTSTVDRDWSDFAIRTSFLPLMQRFLSYLVGALEEREELRAVVGESITLRPADRVPAAVRSPAGTELELRRAEDGSLSLGPLVEPGTYVAVDEKGQPIPSLSFAAQLDPSESNLARLELDALAAHFGEETVQASASGGERPAVPLWTWLFVAAAVAFFLEGVLLRK
jgi:hypothetical protein